MDTNISYEELYFWDCSPVDMAATSGERDYGEPDEADNQPVFEDDCDNDDDCVYDMVQTVPVPASAPISNRDVADLDHPYMAVLYFPKCPQFDMTHNPYAVVWRDVDADGHFYWYFPRESNTYPIRHILKQLGCKWQPLTKRWVCDDFAKLAPYSDKLGRLVNMGWMS